MSDWTIREAQEIAHETAKSKGFWHSATELAACVEEGKIPALTAESLSVGGKLALVMSELGEAIEAHRKLRRISVTEVDCRAMMAGFQSDEELQRMKSAAWFKREVKDTFEDELADVVLRILDLCGYMGIDLQWHVMAKVLYNSTRPHLHGKSY